MTRSGAAPDGGADRRQEWRTYWRSTFPVLVSVHVTWALVVLLLAHVLGGGAGGGFGALLFWLVWNAWSARPGATTGPDRRTEGRQFVPGVWSVERPLLRRPEPVPEPLVPSGRTGASPDRGDHPSRVPLAFWCAVVAVDTGVVATVVLTGVWPAWGATVAAGLLAWHLELLRRATRRRYRSGAG